MFSFRPALLIPLFAIAACAGRGDRDAAVSDGKLFGVATTEFAARTLLQQPGSRRLVDGRVALRGDEELFDLSSRYELVGGDLFARETETFVSSQAPGALGRQVMQQQLQARTPAVFDVPLRLRLQQRQETRLLASAAAAEQTLQSAELTWAPAVADVSLSWLERRGVAPALLSCNAQGAVRFSRFSGGAIPAVQLRARDCDVFSSRLPTISAARSWTASLQWQLAQDETVLRLMSLAPEDRTLGAALRIDPAYELGLMRMQTIGMWKATLDMALRRGSRTAAYAGQVDWSANARLRRRIRDLDVSAGYRAGAGDDWFLPVESAPNDRVELGMSLTPWLDRVMSLDKLDAGVTYSWLRMATAAGEVDEDGLLKGEVRWRW